MQIPSFGRPRQLAGEYRPPSGYVKTKDGSYRRTSKAAGGYDLEEDLEIDPRTGKQLNYTSRRVNPEQAAMDLDRQRAEELRRMRPSGGYMANTGQPPQPASNRYAAAYTAGDVRPPPSPTAPEPEYEDYVDEAELQRLIALARTGFKGTPEMREEDYLDEGLLAQLQAQANQQYQFTPEEYFDDPKARTLAFNRSKDQIGLVNRSALDALREEMAATGRLGSGIEAQLGANILAGGARDLSQFETDQAMSEAEARRGVSERNANRKAARDAQLAGLLPSLSSQARKTRLVPGDPGASMRQQEEYLARLMPQLLQTAKKKRRVA